MLERLSATLAVVAALAGAACSHTPSHPAAVPAAAAAAQIAPWGLDLGARDPSAPDHRPTAMMAEDVRKTFDAFSATAKPRRLPKKAAGNRTSLHSTSI